MRVGGPYSVTVAYTGTAGTAFEPQTQEDVTVNLGVATDLTFNVRAIAVQETVTVSADRRSGLQLEPHGRGDGGQPRRTSRRCRRSPAASATSRA